MFSRLIEAFAETISPVPGTSNSQYICEPSSSACTRRGSIMENVIFIIPLLDSWAIGCVAFVYIDYFFLLIRMRRMGFRSGSSLS